MTTEDRFWFFFVGMMFLFITTCMCLFGAYSYTHRAQYLECVKINQSRIASDVAVICWSR